MGLGKTHWDIFSTQSQRRRRLELKCFDLTKKLALFKGSGHFTMLHSEFLQPAVTHSLFPVTDKKRSMIAVSGDTGDG